MKTELFFFCLPSLLTFSFLIFKSKTDRKIISFIFNFLFSKPEWAWHSIKKNDWNTHRPQIQNWGISWILASSVHLSNCMLSASRPLIGECMLVFWNWPALNPSFLCWTHLLEDCVSRILLLSIRHRLEFTRKTEGTRRPLPTNFQTHWTSENKSASGCHWNL